MLDLCAREPDRVRMFVTVNPNYTEHALGEIDRCVAKSRAVIGIKLLASRRADDPLLDPIAADGAARGFPMLHHIWQHRAREWPSQEISDGADLARLARRHPKASFILAHIGGGGDYMHTFPAVVDCPNIFPDLSGSGVDRGMLDAAVGSARCVAPSVGIATSRCAPGSPSSVRSTRSASTRDERAAIRWRNAARIFPPGSFPRCEQHRASSPRASHDRATARA